MLKYICMLILTLNVAYQIACFRTNFAHVLDWKFLPKGLVVPVLRDVQHMNYLDIESGINALGEKVFMHTFC